jgi:hypothetical protein
MSRKWKFVDAKAIYFVSYAVVNLVIGSDSNLLENIVRDMKRHPSGKKAQPY